MSANNKPVKESVFDITSPLPAFPYGQYGSDLFATAPAYGFMGDEWNQAWMSRRDNRLSGEDLPNYINWYQLKMIRDEQRRICQTNEYAISAINSFKNYVVGTGFSYQVVPKRDNVNPELIKTTQELVDLFCEHNRMSEIENEICYRLHADGEVFLRMFPNYDDGLIRVRFIEPELVRPPSDDSYPDESFGIKCADHDIHERIGYWIIERPYLNLTPTLVDAREIIHIRYNVNSNSKRGLPTTYAIQSNLRACEDVLASLVSLAKSRAKFAAVRTLEMAPPDAVTALGQESTDATITDPTTGQKSNISHYGYGTVLTVPSSVKWEFPSLALGSEDLISTLNVNLRAIASRFGITETQISSDASNNNYASALVAEAPAVKTFQRFGKMMATYLGERRTNPERSLVWNQINHAVKLGILPKEVMTEITIQVNMPSVVTRDIAQEAQVNSIYLQNHIKSRQTISSELGLNAEQERKNFEADPVEAEKKEMQQAQLDQAEDNGKTAKPPNRRPNS